MKTKVVKIGNSRGIRIPKSIIEQTGMQSEVELELKDGAIIIKPSKNTRSNWKSAFIKMANQKDDILMDQEVTHTLTSFDEEEWEW
jgi:antitoxin MazE